jgi:hypothetical protein
VAAAPRAAAAPERWPALARRLARGYLLALGVMIPLVLVLARFITSTRMGRAMRATAQDPEAARLMGINRVDDRPERRRQDDRVQHADRLYKPTSGRILLGERDITAEGRRRARWRFGRVLLWRFGRTRLTFR